MKNGINLAFTSLSFLRETNFHPWEFILNLQYFSDFTLLISTKNLSSTPVDFGFETLHILSCVRESNMLCNRTGLQPFNTFSHWYYFLSLQITYTSPTNSLLNSPHTFQSLPKVLYSSGSFSVLSSAGLSLSALFVFPRVP